jgi:hypothetical protein
MKKIFPISPFKNPRSPKPATGYESQLAESKLHLYSSVSKDHC